MRCLVTGATGLIGRHAVRSLLKAGVEVHAVSQNTTPAGTGPMTWHTADLLDAHSTACLCEAVKATHLLHLAWMTEHGVFWNASENSSWERASKRLIEAFHANGGHRLVVAGTCAEYDWSQLGSGVCREGKTAIRPSTVYGRAKADTHSWLCGYAQTHGLSYAWGRVFLLFGAGEDERRLVPSVARALAEGRVAKCSSGTQVRDFMDARDVGRAFAEILLSDVSGPLNVASGIPHTIAQVVHILGDASGHSDLIHLGVVPDRTADPPVLIADVKRLHDEVGFVPEMVLKDALEDVYRGFKHDC